MVVDWHPAIRVLVAVSIIALQFSRESYVVLPLSTTIAVRAEQPWNAYRPMLVTELGIVVDWHPAIRVLVAVSIIALQLSRESNTMLPLSTTMEVREEHLLNARFPMLVTELGIVIEVREEHLENALSPMLVTE